MRFLKIFGLGLLGLIGAVGVVHSQTSYLPVPSGVCTAANQILTAVDANNVQCSTAASLTTVAASTSLTVGSGTAITKVVVYTASLTPAASSAAIQTAEQTFTVTGLTTADKVFVNGPAPTSLCPPTTFRVSAADTLAIGFTTLTASACTPAAGTYKIVAVRS